MSDARRHTGGRTRTDRRTAPITDVERVMIEYVAQITLIASWFNYINWVADALGVGRDRAQT